MYRTYYFYLLKTYYTLTVQDVHIGIRILYTRRTTPGTFNPAELRGPIPISVEASGKKKKWSRWRDRKK